MVDRGRTTVAGDTQLSQQSTYKTTHFFSTMETFGRNTPFSAMLHNRLTFSTLRSTHPIPHSKFHISIHETCLFAMPSLTFRGTKDGLSRQGWACFATRKMPKGKSEPPVGGQKRIKTTFPLAISRKNVAQLFHQNIQHILPFHQLSISPIAPPCHHPMAHAPAKAQRHPHSTGKEPRRPTTHLHPIINRWGHIEKGGTKVWLATKNCLTLLRLKNSPLKSNQLTHSCQHTTRTL